MCDPSGTRGSGVNGRDTTSAEGLQGEVYVPKTSEGLQRETFQVSVTFVLWSFRYRVIRRLGGLNETGDDSVIVDGSTDAVFGPSVDFGTEDGHG